MNFPMQRNITPRMHIELFHVYLLGAKFRFFIFFFLFSFHLFMSSNFVLGMVAAIGISNLGNVSLDSSRNLFIIGSSLVIGLALPLWIQKNPGVVNTGKFGDLNKRQTFSQFFFI